MIPRIAVCGITRQKIQSKVAPKKFVVTIRYVIQINVNARTKMKKSSSYKNNYSKLTLQQNTSGLTLKKIKPEKI